MKTQILILFAMIVAGSVAAFGQKARSRADDDKAIRQVVQNIVDAWALGDGVKYADNFTDDVVYTVWNGHRINGRDENITGHQEIFDTFYKGTILRSEVKNIRFLSDDIAVAHLQVEMFRDGKKVENVPVVVPVMVLTKTDGRWRVAIFQNTPTIKQGELVLGRKPDPR